MATLIQVFGAGCTLDSSNSADLILKVKWNDVKGALNASTGLTPGTGEDWLSAILYNCMDATSALGQDVKRVQLSALQPSIGSWNSVVSRIYTLTTAFAIVDTGTTRPSAADL